MMRLVMRLGLVVYLLVCMSFVVGREIPNGVKVGREGTILVVATTNKCRSKKLHACKFAGKQLRNGTVLEEKRVVPSGPNPLHNR